MYRLALAYGGLGDVAKAIALLGDIAARRDPPAHDPVFDEPLCPVAGSFNPYNLLVAYGFVDTWAQANPTAAGFTCCNAADLSNPLPSHMERIDHVLTRPGMTVYSARVVGTDRDGRTADGLWPSDHAGVVTALAP